MQFICVVNYTETLPVIPELTCCLAGPQCDKCCQLESALEQSCCREGVWQRFKCWEAVYSNDGFIICLHLPIQCHYLTSELFVQFDRLSKERLFSDSTSLYCPHTVQHACQREHYTRTHKLATISVCKCGWLAESVAACSCLSSCSSMSLSSFHSGLFTQPKRDDVWHRVTPRESLALNAGPLMFRSLSVFDLLNETPHPE